MTASPNLLAPGTEAISESHMWEAVGSTISRDSDAGHPVGDAAIRCEPLPTAITEAGAYAQSSQGVFTALLAGTTFTLSAWVLSARATVKLLCRDDTNSAMWESEIVPVTVGEWQRVSATFTVPPDRSLERVYVVPAHDATEITGADVGWFAGVQLELGESMTDWLRSDSDPQVDPEPISPPAVTQAPMVMGPPGLGASPDRTESGEEPLIRVGLGLFRSQKEAYDAGAFASTGTISDPEDTQHVPLEAIELPGEEGHPGEPEPPPSEPVGSASSSETGTEDEEDAKPEGGRTSAKTAKAKTAKTKATKIVKTDTKADDDG
jgi:hypothetical protein